MANWMFGVGTFTPGAGTADATTLTTGTYMAIVGGGATSFIYVDEVYLGGQAASTAPLIMLLARDSTNGATPTTLVTPNSFGALNPLSSALSAVPVAFVAATTQPSRATSVTLGKKNFTFNAFGGIVRANYANTNDRFATTGATASTGEMSLSSFTGSTAGAAVGGHILIEIM